MSRRDTVTVGGLVIPGRPHLTDREPSGIFLGPAALDDLLNGVDVRREDVPVPNGPGTFAQRAYPASRLVTLSGLIVAPTVTMADVHANLLKRVLSDGLEHDFSYNVGDVQRSGVAGRYGVPRIKPYKHRWASGTRQVVAEWQLQLLFSDPYLYGETSWAAGGFPLMHRGNTNAYPSYSLVGVLPAGTTILHPNGRFRYEITRGITNLETAAVDMRTGQLRINGALVHGGVGRADTWTLAPHDPQVFTATNNAVLYGSVRDTFE